MRYLPFQPLEGVYDSTDSGVMVTRALAGLFRLFGLPPAAFHTKFRNCLREVLDQEMPNLRCSTARAVLEGRIPDIPKPISNVPSSSQAHLRAALLALDLMETVVCKYLEKEGLRKDPKVLQEIEEAREVLQEKKHVPKKKSKKKKPKPPTYSTP